LALVLAARLARSISDPALEFPRGTSLLVQPLASTGTMILTSFHSQASRLRFSCLPTTIASALRPTSARSRSFRTGTALGQLTGPGMSEPTQGREHPNVA